MTNTIIAALITGGLSLLGIIITCIVTIQSVSKKFETKVEVAMAVQNEKIDELTREVREHNGFAKRMPVVENEIKHIENDIQKLQSYHN